jgi:hypothetical protein
MQSTSTPNTTTLQLACVEAVGVGSGEKSGRPRGNDIGNRTDTSEFGE